MRKDADARPSPLRDDRRRMKRIEDRGAAGQEAPMVISPRMVARLIRQIVTTLRAIARKESHGTIRKRT